MQTSIPQPPGPPAGGAMSAPAAAVPAAQPSYAAVSWSAVAPGAVAAAALGFILLVLGVGLEWSAASPWSYSDVPLSRHAIAWVTFMELASSAVGGYMAGRLRVRWFGVHGDEVYFRDTAHGLLAWAVATLLSAALMAGAVRAALGGAAAAAGAVAGTQQRPDTGAGAGADVGSDVGAGARTGAGAGAGTAVGGAGNAAGAAVPAHAPGGDALAAIAPQAAASADSAPGSAHPGAESTPGYYTDLLLRADGAPAADSAGVRAEVQRILDSQPAGLSADDRQYLARIVAKRTGLEPSDAERRVDDVTARLAQKRKELLARARSMADEARKAGAYSALWMFFALLLGAFAASLAATFGGRQRDFASPPVWPATPPRR